MESVGTAVATQQIPALSTGVAVLVIRCFAGLGLTRKNCPIGAIIGVIVGVVTQRWLRWSGHRFLEFPATARLVARRRSRQCVDLLSEEIGITIGISYQL